MKNKVIVAAGLFVLALAIVVAALYTLAFLDFAATPDFVAIALWPIWAGLYAAYFRSRRAAWVAAALCVPVAFAMV